MSNTAGATSYDVNGKLASEVQKGTGVDVLPHAVKKPGCGDEILAYFRQHPETGVTSPNQIAIVGDRLATDMMLANMMGSWGVWVKDGVVPLEQKSIVSLGDATPFLVYCIVLTSCISSPGSRGNWHHTSFRVDTLLLIRPAHLNEWWPRWQRQPDKCWFAVSSQSEVYTRTGSIIGSGATGHSIGEMTTSDPRANTNNLSNKESSNCCR